MGWRPKRATETGEALVTGVGIVPLALGLYEPGEEIQQPMAVVILGGIVTSTFLKR